MLDATEVIVTDHSDIKLKETSLPDTKVIAKERTSVELKHAYNLEPHDGDEEFLCCEELQQMPCGRWIQQ
eukprot:7477132-Pyramimonas_sp.AAC.1